MLRTNYHPDHPSLSVSEGPLLFCNITAKIIFILFAALSLTSCFTRIQVIDPESLPSLEDLHVEEPRDVGDGGVPILSNIRTKSLQDTAMSIAAQGGLGWSSKQINRRLERDGWYLETTYNFNGMMLSHGVVPPVLEEGGNTLNLADPNTIRVSDKTYKIIQQARFATTPPNWREYLWMNYTKPEIPNKVLLPRTKAEQRIWALAIRKGWEQGILQAYSIFHQNLARLRRDYQGMILYRKLLQQHMISAPYVSRTELGVTGDGSDMRINDQVLRITELPRLQTESKGWKAIVESHD